MFRRLHIKHQRGFTLIEVLIALAITGFISASIAMACAQLLTVNALSGGHITTLRQVENAMYYINRDTQMTQTIQTTPGSGFPLTLKWTEWNGISHQVMYRLAGNTLERNHSVNGGEPQRLIVAHYINPAMTDCLLLDGVLTCKITASVGGLRPSSETRTLQVAPRPALCGI